MDGPVSTDRIACAQAVRDGVVRVLERARLCLPASDTDTAHLLAVLNALNQS